MRSFGEVCENRVRAILYYNLTHVPFLVNLILRCHYLLGTCVVPYLGPYWAKSQLPVAIAKDVLLAVASPHSTSCKRRG